MKIDHIAIYTHELENMKDFFVKYFNGTARDKYHNTKSGFMSYFISFEDNTRIEIMTRPELNLSDKEKIGVGYHHLSFSLGGRKKVDKLTSELSKDGYNVISGPRTTGDGYYESQISIIEGNIIEITE